MPSHINVQSYKSTNEQSSTPTTCGSSCLSPSLIDLDTVFKAKVVLPASVLSDHRLGHRCIY
jgi:hypothetical protein